MVRHALRKFPDLLYIQCLVILAGLYPPLEDMLKQVMERELQVIVREEK